MIVKICLHRFPFQCYFRACLSIWDNISEPQSAGVGLDLGNSLCCQVMSLVCMCYVVSQENKKLQLGNTKRRKEEANSVPVEITFLSVCSSSTWPQVQSWENNSRRTRKEYCYLSPAKPTCYIHFSWNNIFDCYNLQDCWLEQN